MPARREEEAAAVSIQAKPAYDLGSSDGIACPRLLACLVLALPPLLGVLMLFRPFAGTVGGIFTFIVCRLGVWTVA